MSAFMLLAAAVLTALTMIGILPFGEAIFAAAVLLLGSVAAWLSGRRKP